MNVKILLLIIFLLGILTRATSSDDRPKWSVAELNTASNAEYLSELEKELVLEINKLRSDPPRYAEEYIAPLASAYNRRILHYPGDQPLLTTEGVSALNECVRVLKRQDPLPLMYPSSGLSEAARDHVRDQARTGKTGHTGSDKSSMRQRIERYGTWQIRIAENIAYGAKNARQIVIYLLIDDGVRDRGHRENFLNPDFKIVGVAAGNHSHYGVMCVMDFAGGYQSSGK